MFKLFNSDDDEERKTRNHSRGENLQLESDPGSLGTSASSSREYGTDKIPVSGILSERSNSDQPSNRCTNTVVGKILRQLIGQTYNQVAHRLEDIKRLEKEIQELKNQADEWGQLLEALEEPSSEDSEDQA